MEIINFDKKKKAPKSKKTSEDRESFLYKAATLSEALPYIQKFAGEIFVIKFGGSAMGNPEIVKSFAKDVVLLKKIGINPIIVHGGGPQIGAMLEKMNIKSSFIDGLRVTDNDTVDVVEMVLSGSINKSIVSAINQAGGFAIGLSGKDANLITARKLRKVSKDTDSNIEKILDLGFVGEPTKINPEIFMALDESDIIPVIAPIGLGEEGQTYNINADSVAGAIAAEIKACKLIMLTDVDGVLSKSKKLISSLSIKEAKNLMEKKIIHGGMIPKIQTCIKALDSEVGTAHILNGTVKHITLLEIFTEHGAGTMINH
jgi:acetylglutamate kinase